MQRFFRGQDDLFLIAEIGGNHEGSISRAVHLFQEAAQSGANAVKLQIYTGDSIVSPVEGAQRNKHFKKFELTVADYEKLIDLAGELRIEFMASLWSLEEIDKFDPYITVHKVGSGDLTNYPILKRLAEIGKPLILSTGMSDIEEIVKTVEFIDSINPNLRKQNNLCLMHCVAMYGAPEEEHAQLYAIRKLQDMFPDIHIGYSDHTRGTYACQLAVAMGCSVIEKHFTDDPSREFRDHALSVRKDEMLEFCEAAKRTQVLLGAYEKTPVEGVETPERIVEFRRAVYLTRDAPSGTCISEEMLTTLRPNKGIDARRFYEVIGKTLKCNKKAFEAIQEEEIEW